jgi:hypothetical protein
MKDELKSVLKPLIAKDLEKYLFELKEIFYVHMVTPKFVKKLNFSRSYGFENLNEIIQDQSPFAKLFADTRIWQYKYLATPSASKPNVDLSQITEQDRKLFEEFTDIAGTSWSEESVYKMVKSDVAKLDFLPIFNNFTDELLDKIIDTEASFDHAAGSFFSIDLASVNNYLVTALLAAHTEKNTQFIRQYSLI